MSGPIHGGMRDPDEGSRLVLAATSGKLAPVCARCTGVASRKAGLPMTFVVESALIVRDGEVYRVIARCHGEEAILEVRESAGLEEVERAIRDARMFRGGA